MATRVFRHLLSLLLTMSLLPWHVSAHGRLRVPTPRIGGTEIDVTKIALWMGVWLCLLAALCWAKKRLHKYPAKPFEGDEKSLSFIEIAPTVQDAGKKVGALGVALGGSAAECESATAECDSATSTTSATVRECDRATAECETAPHVDCESATGRRIACGAEGESARVRHGDSGVRERIACGAEGDRATAECESATGRQPNSACPDGAVAVKPRCIRCPATPLSIVDDFDTYWQNATVPQHYELGDMILLGPNCIPYGRRLAVITELKDKYCHAVVLGYNGGKHVGESPCWPYYHDIRLDSARLRLNTPVVIRGFPVPKFKRVNGCTAVVISHVQMGHPVFYKTPGRAAVLSTVVKFDDPERAGMPEVMMDPRFVFALPAQAEGLPAVQGAEAA